MVKTAMVNNKNIWDIAILDTTISQLENITATKDHSH